MLSPIIILFLLVCQVNAQTIQDPNNAVLLSDNFDSNQGRLTFYADNRDFCDYYLYISFIHAEGFLGMASSASVVVNHGQRQILSYKVMKNASKIRYNYRYAMYRGDPNKKTNVDFAYCLPVAKDESVTAEAVENSDGYQLVFDLPSDTVYACRNGIVCDDKLKDFTAKGYKNFNDHRNQSQITLCHEDGSFGEYVFMGKSLVFSGQQIKMGSPIAIVQNLENNRAYICEHTDEMLMQDMNKGEKSIPAWLNEGLAEYLEQMTF